MSSNNNSNFANTSSKSKGDNMDLSEMFMAGSHNAPSKSPAPAPASTARPALYPRAGQMPPPPPQQYSAHQNPTSHTRSALYLPLPRQFAVYQDPSPEPYPTQMQPPQKQYQSQQEPSSQLYDMPPMVDVCHPLNLTSQTEPYWPHHPGTKSGARLADDYPTFSGYSSMMEQLGDTTGETGPMNDGDLDFDQMFREVTAHRDESNNPHAAQFSTRHEIGDLSGVSEHPATQTRDFFSPACHSFMDPNTFGEEYCDKASHPSFPDVPRYESTFNCAVHDRTMSEPLSQPPTQPQMQHNMISQARPLHGRRVVGPAYTDTVEVGFPADVDVDPSHGIKHLVFWCATDFCEVEYPVTFTLTRGKAMFNSKGTSFQQTIQPPQNVRLQQNLHPQQTAHTQQCFHPAPNSLPQQNLQPQQLAQPQHQPHPHVQAQPSVHNNIMASVATAAANGSVIQPRASLKRKPDEEPPDASHTTKKVKSDTSVQQPQLRDTSVTATPRKKARYAALNNVKDAELPDYSQIRLTYPTRNIALSNSKKGLQALEKHFLDSNMDASIPQTNAQRQDAARIILGAMKDTSRAKDVGSKHFNSRWAADAKNKYDNDDLETTAWEIVNLAERLHREGPSTLSNRDPHYFPYIKSSAHLTFEQRITVIATLSSEWKARNDGLIKGTTLETSVAAPLEALQSARNNFAANKDRGKKLDFAKKHENDEDAPKLKEKKRKPSKKNLTVAPAVEVDAVDASVELGASFPGVDHEHPDKPVEEQLSSQPDFHDGFMSSPFEKRRSLGTSTIGGLV